MIRRLIRILFRMIAVLMLCGVVAVVVVSRFVPEGRAWRWNWADVHGNPPTVADFWLRREGVEMRWYAGFISQPEIEIDEVVLAAAPRWRRYARALKPSEYHVADPFPWYEIDWEGDDWFMTDRTVRVHMVVLIPLGIGLAVTLWFVGGWVSRRRGFRNGLCPICGYDLRATPERCPECGWGAEGVGKSPA